MGKLQEFQIAFDTNKVVYNPGESISGTVKIKLGQPLQCKGKSPQEKKNKPSLVHLVGKNVARR